MKHPQKIMRILRESQDYSQEYVADVLNINQKTYSNLESGKSKLTVDRIQQLADLYHVKPDYFLSEELPVINFNNTGPKSNSNSGYIHTYVNEKSADAFYERLLLEKDLQLKEKESQISLLKEMIEVLKSKIENLIAK
ncbi:helix-turn-helix transcriptional regulator [uncultured Algoriphagus sp.]|uniref:helix-turn-helix domain-containing protein n=1 Tax=uncultured Algoriphagus sp. TaxID=417365 RepID=UPI0030EB9CCE|tara:strand:- start:8721 stop:9134 length:414 start_codon:yes stop_codon:yes gene_type:complete